jgi:hypothetical protein
MKKRVKRPLSSLTVLVTLSILFPFFSVNAQNSKGASAALPDSVSKIVTRSCMPCHSNDGGMRVRNKLNFSIWSEYTAVQQAERSNKIYLEIYEGKMPPERFREDKPELIPDQKQIEIIKKWAEALNTPQQ